MQPSAPVIYINPSLYRASTFPDSLLRGFYMHAYLNAYHGIFDASSISADNGPTYSKNNHINIWFLNRGFSSFAEGLRTHPCDRGGITVFLYLGVCERQSRGDRALPDNAIIRLMQGSLFKEYYNTVVNCFTSSPPDAYLRQLDNPVEGTMCLNHHVVQ